MPGICGISLDLHCKGEKLKRRICNGSAETFLVEIISPAADRLCKDQAGCKNVTKRKKGNFPSAAEKPCGQETGNDRTVDGDSAFPDSEYRKKIVFKLVP